MAGVLRRTAALPAVFIVLSSAVSGAGLVREALGPIPAGRGGVNLAFNDNLAVIHDNPSGLVEGKRLRLDLGLDLVKIGVEYEDPRNDTVAEDDVLALPMAAVAWRIREAPLPVVLGLGLFIPAGCGVEYEMDHQVLGRQRYLSESSFAKLLFGGAVGLGPGLSLGAAVGAAHDRSRLEVPYTFQTAALRGVPALVDLEAEGFGVAWNVGLQYRPTARWTIGLAYIAETRVDQEGSFKVDATGVVPGADLTARYDLKVEKTWPRSLGMGTSYRFDRGTISLDFLWFDWSSAFGDYVFHLSDGDNPFFDGLAGATPSDRFPLEWHDGYALRIGGEAFLTEWDTIRVGYSFTTNPVPSGTLTPILPATIEHTLSVGYGRKVGPAMISLAYQYSVGSRNSVGKSSLVGGDFDHSSTSTHAHTLFLGIGVGFGEASPP